MPLDVLLVKLSCPALAALLTLLAADPAIQNFDRLIALGKYQDAEKPLELYVASHPRSWEALYQLGYVYFRLHKIWPSVQVLSRSLSINTKNAEAHKILGMDLTILERADLAKKEFRDAIRIDPRSAESHYSLGRIYYEQGDYSQAVEEIEKALDLKPDYVKAWHNLALAYEAIDDLTRARRLFEKALELNRNQQTPSEWPFLNYASFSNRRGEYEHALELLGSALAINPRSDEAHFQAAKAYRGLGRWRACVDELQQAIQINPNNAEFFYMLSLAYRQLNDPEKSQASLEQFQKLKTWESSPQQRPVKQRATSEEK